MKLCIYVATATTSALYKIVLNAQKCIMFVENNQNLLGKRYNNNNNNPICKAPECQKTSVALYPSPYPIPCGEGHPFPHFPLDASRPPPLPSRNPKPVLSMTAADAAGAASRYAYADISRERMISHIYIFADRPHTSCSDWLAKCYYVALCGIHGSVREAINKNWCFVNALPVPSKRLSYRRGIARRSILLSSLVL